MHAAAAGEGASLPFHFLGKGARIVEQTFDGSNDER